MVFSPGHSSWGLKEHMAWASPGHIPGHWEGLLGLVTSLGSSLNARHSPWTSGQLGKAPGPWPGWNQLEKAGEGWTRLLGLSGPGLTLWHSQNTLTHSFQELCWLTLKVLFLVIFGLFELCTFLTVLTHFGQNDTFCSFDSFAVLAISGPILGAKMSQGLLGLCCLM